MTCKMRDVVVVACVVFCIIFGANVWLKIKDYFINEAKVTEIAVSKTEFILPVVDISLNGVTLGEIHNDKSIKYGGNTLSLTTDAGVKEYYDVEIKGRGNSTWAQPKRPYQIKFQDKVSFLGMEKAKKWILLANSLDVSELRTDIAFYLERMLSVKYALSGEFIELHVDGENLGVYFVTPKMEIDKNRIDLRDPMGILVEMDNLHVTDDEVCYITNQGNCLIISDAVTDSDIEVVMTDFVRQFNVLEQAAQEGDYQTVIGVADVESLAKYYLLEEFTVNPDAYNTSYYFYRDGLDDKIHAGPGWDFDYALGNRKWQWQYIENFYSPTQTQVQRNMAFGNDLHNAETGVEIDDDGYGAISRIIYYLMDISEFQNLVKRIFVEKMQGRKEELLTYIRNRMEIVGEMICADNVQWGKNSFDEEMGYLLWWVEARYDYFEQEYGV